MEKIIVLGGGNSPEREVSLRSAKAVCEAVEKAGYEVELIDPANGYEQLDRIDKSSIVLPILHGAGGEDGTIQSELEIRELRYLGADSRASKICFDKWLTRKMLQKHGMDIANGAFVDKKSYPKNAIANAPHVLKVNHGGSSIGTLIIRDPKNISQAEIDEIFNLDSHAVLEELVDGVELTVPILDGLALPVIEIRPPDNSEFDYANKYNGQTKELCPPQSISADLQKKAQLLAQKVHRVTGCRHLSRIDMIVRPTGKIIVLEINTIPGMTNQSLFPKSAAVAGIDFIEVVKRFIHMAARIEYAKKRV